MANQQKIQKSHNIFCQHANNYEMFDSSNDFVCRQSCSNYILRNLSDQTLKSRLINSCPEYESISISLVEFRQAVFKEIKIYINSDADYVEDKRFPVVMLMAAAQKRTICVDILCFYFGSCYQTHNSLFY